MKFQVQSTKELFRNDMRKITIFLSMRFCEFLPKNLMFNSVIEKQMSVSLDRR